MEGEFVASENNRPGVKNYTLISERKSWSCREGLRDYVKTALHDQGVTSCTVPQKVVLVREAHQGILLSSPLLQRARV
jgi:hypothetical protein